MDFSKLFNVFLALAKPKFKISRLRTKVVEWVKVLNASDLLGLWQCLGLFARVISSVCECNVHICFCICLWVWPEGFPPLGCLVGWLVSRWGTWLVNSHQLVVVALRPSRQCDRTLWSDWPRQRSGYMVQRNIRHSLDFRHQGLDPPL